jgi:indole-3-glycerol phosphate synthase
MTSDVPDLLAAIVAATRTAVHGREARQPIVAFENGRRKPAGDTFVDRLRATDGPRIIAECKRRSPSRGILRAAYHPAEHARAYAAAGAAAISVLTEPTFFDGRLQHLADVRQAVDVPLLRKDFIVTDYQVHEAAAFGADAILLIVSALTDEELARLLALAGSLDLAALVEVHDKDELRRAADAGARVIGVNSRNLRTLNVDPQVLEELGPLLPPGAVAVAESGIRSGDDLRRLRAAGYHAFLVGERLIAQPDPGAALKELRES